jgi:hypothetical protein
VRHIAFVRVGFFMPGKIIATTGTAIITDSTHKHFFSIDLDWKPG